MGRKGGGTISFCCRVRLDGLFLRRGIYASI